MELYKRKQKLTPSFQINQSLFVNPTPDFQEPLFSPVANDSESEQMIHNDSDLQKDEAEEEQTNPVKEFIVRMTPMAQRRKFSGNSYYKNALMNAAGIKEKNLEESFGKENDKSSSQKKLFVSPFKGLKKQLPLTPLSLSPKSDYGAKN